MSSFFPHDTIVNCVLDREEKQTGPLNDFLLVHPESPAELLTQMTGSTMMKVVELSLFFFF